VIPRPACSRARSQDERPRPEVKTAILFDEIAARKKAVGQLLDGALRRAHGSCQFGQSDAALAQRHDLEDLYDSVNRAMRADRHAADGSKPYRPQTGTCTEGAGPSTVAAVIQISGYRYVNTYKEPDA
jgi:hypothetical protein